MQWAPNLCRICGHIREICHFINQGNIDMEHKLKRCLHLDITKDDYKPKQICNGCFIKLNKFHEFLSMCESTNARFESMYISKPDWNPNSSIMDYNKQQKITVIVSSKAVRDSLSHSNIDPMLPLDNMNMTGCSLSDQPLLPNYYPGFEENKNHFMGYDTNYFSQYYNQSSAVQRSSNYQTPDNPCSSNAVINYSGTDETIVDQDLNKIGCNFYSKHNDFTHKAATTEQCSGNANTNTLNNTGVDLTKDNLEETKLQEVVEKPVEKTENLDKTIHTPVENVNKCKIVCSQVRRTKKKEAIIECNQCKKKFLRKVALNAHMANHETRHRFLCDVCNKSFADQSDLRNHQRVHTDIYKCKYCRKEFSERRKLEQHLKTHSNNCPYVCSYKNCMKQFSDKRCLDSHENTHSEEHCDCDLRGKNLQYKCNLCGKRYKRIASLLTHKKTHGYFCPYCEREFKEKSKLDKHTKKCRVRHNRH